MFKNFFEKFDKKRFFSVMKIIIIFIFIVFAINIGGIAYSRYESNALVSADANVAFFVIDQGTYEESISLSGLTPSPNPFYYTFNVSNFKDGKRANVTLKYKINFEVTTNIPLQYEMVLNENFTTGYTNILPPEQLRQDDYGVYYKYFDITNYRTFDHTQNHTDQYKLKVIFPENLKNNSEAYAGMIELFSIIIDAEQVA